MFQANEVTDGITSGVEARKQRGMELAALCKINKLKDGSWSVPSSTGNGRYIVQPNQRCTCPDHETRGCICKHMFAVEIVMKREWSPDGTETISRSVTVTESISRKTYPQDWPAYNAAQVNEKDVFLKLLHELCKDVAPIPQKGRGQRRLAMADAVFSVTFKIYSTVSGRRFMSDLRQAHERGYIDAVPHFNSIFNYLENPLMTEVLEQLIEVSSKPLATVESDFAVDSTGFMSSRFYRWYDHKYGGVKQEHDWVKAHIICGVKTNVITAVKILDKNAADSTQLPALVDATTKNFNVKEVSADKGYSSADNTAHIALWGATPFIPYKANSTGERGGKNGMFGKMFRYFQYQQEEFLAHYHKRSNVESTVMMIKTKFRDDVRSKTDVSMKNEVLCKILCHNLCCLISAMYELSIDPKFFHAPTKRDFV